MFFLFDIFYLIVVSDNYITQLTLAIKGFMNVKKFKNKLFNDGRTLRWFYLSFIKCRTKLGYSGFTSQLNGYAPISNKVRDIILKYMEG